MSALQLPLSTLTEEQKANRIKGIGASDAYYLLNDKWMELWELKTGRREPDDLSRNLAVQMGCLTEEFNVAWYEQETAWPVIERNSSYYDTELPFMTCNLDGKTYDPMDDSDDAKVRIFEAKHLSAWDDIDKAVKKYYGQLQHQMFVTGCDGSVLSCFFGNSKWDYTFVEYDEKFIKSYVDMCWDFWNFVLRDEPPIVETPKISIAFKDMKKMDMRKSKIWNQLADVWQKNRDSAKAFKDSEAGLKSLVPDDVRTAFGSGVYISRAKNNALTIRPMTEKKLKEFEDD